MKYLQFTLSLLAAALFVPQTHAVSTLPFLGGIRSKVIVQFDLATNGVPQPNKKLVAALKKALTTIDKTRTNYAAGSKSLGALAKLLSSTTLTNHSGVSLSNIFADELSGTVEDYVDSMLDLEDDLADDLASTVPSAAHTATQKSLNLLLNALSGADTNSNLILATKYLGTAAKNVGAAQKALVKAQGAPTPANNLTATVTATGQGTFTYKPIIQSVQAAYVSGTHILNITSTDIKTSGTSISNIDVQTKNIGLVLTVPADGTYTYNLSTDSSLIYFSYDHTHGQALVAGDAFPADSGTVTLTFNSATKLVFGTFSFTGNGQDDAGATATVNGSFSLHYLQ